MELLSGGVLQETLNPGHTVFFAAEVCWSLGLDFLGELFFADEWPHRCLW